MLMQSLASPWNWSQPRNPDADSIRFFPNSADPPAAKGNNYPSMARQSTDAKPIRQLRTNNAVISLLSLPSPDLRGILLTYHKLGRDELFFVSNLSIDAGDHYMFTRKPKRES